MANQQHSSQPILYVDVITWLSDPVRGWVVFPCQTPLSGVVLEDVGGTRHQLGTKKYEVHRWTNKSRFKRPQTGSAIEQPTGWACAINALTYLSYSYVYSPYFATNLQLALEIYVIHFAILAFWRNFFTCIAYIERVYGQDSQLITELESLDFPKEC